MKIIFRNIKLAPICGLLAAALTACGSGVAQFAPDSTPLATATAAPLYQQVSLTSVPAEEDSQSPAYKITTQTPTLTGSDDPRLAAFNQETSSLVKQAVEAFKQNMADLGPAPIPATSTFDLRYALVSSPGYIYSIKFDTEGYVAGAAHPYHLTYTLNYDLEEGKDLSLADLFLPNSGYLEVIANYCTSQLMTRDIGFDAIFQQGAAPLPENYKNWNITPDGLMITFDEYQVAPYAAGPQTVVVPYVELIAIIDLQGPLEK